MATGASTATATVHRPSATVRRTCQSGGRLRGCTPVNLRGRRDDLAGVQDAGRIERGLERAVHAQADRAEFALEPVALEQPDAVLAGDGAAERQAERHDVVERSAAGREARRIGAVDDDVRMQVAVAGVADGGDSDPGAP